MSATLSSEVQSLQKLILHTPAILELEEEEEDLEEEALKQFTVKSKEEDKFLLLYVMLKLNLLSGKTIVFVRFFFPIVLFDDFFDLRILLRSILLSDASRLSSSLSASPSRVLSSIPSFHKIPFTISLNNVPRSFSWRAVQGLVAYDFVLVNKNVIEIIIATDEKELRQKKQAAKKKREDADDVEDEEGDSNDDMEEDVRSYFVFRMHCISV